MFIKNLIQSLIKMFKLSDKAASIDTWKEYGRNQTLAKRNPKTRYDIQADTVNANVNIAVRAIDDAIKSLPAKIVVKENIGGIAREKDDAEHEANNIINNPNPEQTFRQIVSHLDKSYLLDGNGYLTIERMTGGNSNIELWPRNPQTMEMLIDNARPAGYKVGSEYGIEAKIYKRQNVIHIRETSPQSLFYGVSRINSVRDEIMMDYFINQFNKKFFQSGAVLNLMFTPDNNLTDEQHQQLLDALTDDLGGVDNAFKIFVNKFAGKIESPDQKHKDIAFLELAKFNREKIFGVFGLPPFRGGIMEYANYANALAQDLDFWNNTIRPILMVLEDAFNKQLIWPLYGQDVSIKFDMSDVPAIKGDPKVQMEIDKGYVECGVLTQNEIREKLNRPPKEKDGSQDISVSDKPKVAVDKKTVDETANSIYNLFRIQRTEVIKRISDYCIDGKFMSHLMDADREARIFFDVAKYNKQFINAILPIFKAHIQIAGTEFLFNNHVDCAFDTKDSAINTALDILSERLCEINRTSLEQLKFHLLDAETFNLPYKDLLTGVKNIFGSDRATDISKILCTELSEISDDIANNQLFTLRIK